MKALTRCLGAALPALMFGLVHAQPYIDARWYGVKCDGRTDDSASIRAAVDAANQGGLEVLFPPGVCVTGKVEIYSHTRIRGQGREKTTLRLKDGAHTDLIYGKDSDVLWGTNADAGIVNYQIIDLSLDGNRAHNRRGSALAVYGQRPLMRNVGFKNAAEHCVRTEWHQWGEAAFGMEGHFQNLKIDTCGQHGWLFRGPHDSVIVGVEIIDASQSSDNAYDGFRQEDFGNARVFGLHVWSRSTAKRFPRYALAITGGQSEFTNSHFEGGKTANALIHSPRTQMRGVSLYGARGGVNLHLRAGEVRFDGFLGPSVSGTQAVTGIKFGDGPSDYVSGTIIHADAAEQTGGFADFTHSAGHNYVVVRGILSAGVTYVGRPSPNDTVDARFGGAASFALHHTPYAVGIVASGTAQIDATVLSPFARTHHVSGVSSGAGVRLWTPAGGEEVLIFNAGANALKVYPASGGRIRLAEPNAAITIPSGTGVYLRSISAWQWVSAP